ncbi:hypothetical protein DYU11_24820 [Fibrisoma montanum]|uniref:DUF3575 domain-containing protein n=1 Tax=Fibrisoma montanum TaxID=2305895 RepID=A0A418M151_9BACT|nr:hypothetical protein [Fibrisoma montanum]RIV19333.1 hypothetical protein DYU11_24820 [Fibrisoma montanum]
MISLFRLGCLFAFGSLLASCSRFHTTSDLITLNKIYQIKPRQHLYALDRRGNVRVKQLMARRAQAALYEREDTLYAEFLSKTLPPPDQNPATLDQSDSLTIFFFHYNPKLKQIEEKSPWFQYQLTSFDVDLFTAPFKYRFGQAGQPGELTTSANLGVYAGIRYDVGRYQNIYFRRERRSNIESFGFGFGTFVSIDPVAVNAFSTAGRFAGEYEALGYNYGALGLVGYKTVTVGLALGFENLADRNNRIWIYRQKPWLGVTLGVNLN